MSTYVTLGNWTNQGVHEVKNGPKRLDAAKDLAKSLGGEIKGFYMTMGTHDLIVVWEAPNDAAAARMMLQIGMAGALRTTTLKAFPEPEYREIIKSLA
jgi:uncharacterized protein with GYD domain